MHNVEINVFPIAKTALNRPVIKNWLDYVGATDYELPQDEITDREILVGLAAKRCYMSFEPGLNPNVTKVRKDWTEYLDNILKSRHGSTLEHATWTWAIENVSRVFTGELNRHRAGMAISEGSMRYIRYNDIPWWIPFSLRIKDTDDNDTIKKKEETVNIFNDIYKYIETKYQYLVNDVWNMDNIKSFDTKKKITSCLRRIIPMGVATGGVWTGNLRALRHILALRCSEHAEEEIAYVFSLIGKEMVISEPKLFGDFVQNNDGYWIPKYDKV